MQTNKFTDAAGREWPLRIGTVALERMNEAGIPLEEIVPMPGSTNADAGMMMLADLVHHSPTGVKAVLAILGPALEKAGVTRLEFLESIDTPEILLALGQALQAAIVDFFHDSPIRQSVVRSAISRGQRVMKAATKQMEKAMESVDIEAEMEKRAAAMEAKPIMPATMPTMNGQPPQPGSISATNTQAS